MSRLEELISGCMDSSFLEHPSSTMGKILSYDWRTNLANIIATNPKGLGQLRYTLPIPKQYRGLFHPGPIQDAQVTLAFPGGNTQYAQVVAVLPPLQSYSSERNSLGKERTYTGRYSFYRL